MENKRVELLVARSAKHGQAGRETKSRTYLIWQSMIGRCHRPSDSSYRWYGAKGVTVCDRWRKFEDFFADMGTAPDGMHIHRTSGSSVYSKETCVWMNESEHIGLHNTEQGWGARMTRAQLIDALTGAKAQLAAERDRAGQEGVKIGLGAKHTLVDENHQLRKQLAAEREKADARELQASISHGQEIIDSRSVIERDGERILELKQQLAAAVEALSFYADVPNWRAMAAQQDQGHNARCALAKIREKHE